MVFYCVTSKFDNKGNGWAGITEKRECDEIPVGTFRSTKKADYYTDWFGSYEEAEAFVRSTK
jgi:hypothetical protein